MRKEPLETGSVYHIFNRGVEKREIFQKEADYLRFVHSLYDFNDKNPAENIYYKSPILSSYEVGPRKKRKQFIQILAFCLMPNHYHLLLKQSVDQGITDFMRKLGTGYTMYFNQKYERVGPLFQGRFKSVLIEKNNYFSFIPHYIHLNPLDLIGSEWRDGKIKDSAATLNFLKNYQWSSYRDYIGTKNFPNLSERDLILGVFGGPKHYQKDLADWFTDPTKTIVIKSQVLES